MIRGDLMRRLGNGEVVVGAFSPYREVPLAEQIARAFDFIVWDGEHGLIEPADTPALSLACHRAECTPIVRVPSPDDRVIGRFLDLGADGIMAPMIETGDQATDLLAAMQYPPQGRRGVAMTRNLEFGMADNIPGLLQNSNKDAIAIAQIETRRAVENIDAILGVAEVDIVFIGPADLSLSLGCPLQFQHPDFIAAVVGIVGKARAAQKHVGILVDSPNQIPALKSLGVRMFACYLDSLLMSAVTEFTAAFEK
ncbi:hypothetical protein KCG44_11335 [Pacificimonas sp. WHA3]|uniref:HpcH/HpaI aldolase/citrate lyase domain-containing protein n=1 Tax=Pacificimonas pallii TaxID=2827236 RepID=A0ABS6SG26_9SPHN|nr:aldolase/citrate lyase family protein [Pacificimonas pallii]MBV7257378.1 hypothetical protein [Pacificimonas pallii]